ncbi:hypothetical protein IPZ77_03635 [Streptomyces sp. XC 2026]|nr:hypothetical protein IPZ77_03635 [Streptomyces sp. XC 2026]
MGLLSWLGWGRGREKGRAPEAGESSPATASGAGWRDVPPVQRMTGAGVPLVTDPTGFRGSLSAWQNVSVTGELGHHVDEAAPGGVGHALATPSVQTFAPRAARVPGLVGGGEDSSGAMATAGFGPAPGGAAGPVVGAESGDGAPPVPVQRLADPSTSAGEVPLPVVRRLAVVQPDPPVAPRDPGSPPTVERGGLGLGEPLTALPPTAQRDVVARSTATGSEIGSRAGSGPDTGVVSDGRDGETTAPLLGDAPSLSVQGHGWEEGGGAEAPQAGEAAAGGLEGLGAGPSGSLSVSRSSGVSSASGASGTFGSIGSGGSSGPAGPPGSAGGASSFSPVPLQRHADDDATPEHVPAVLPLVAQRSLTVLPSWEHPAAEPSPAPTSVPVRWSDERGHAERTPAVGSTLRRADPAPAVQRSSPAPATPPPVPADAGSVAVAAGIAQRMADGSVVFRPSPSPGPSAVPAPPPASPGPAVQRDADSAEPPVPEAEFTPSFDTSEQPEPVSDPTPETSTASGTGPSAPPDDGAGGEASPKVTDELVRALFAPLSRLLRTELRLERERSGHLINTRH